MRKNYGFIHATKLKTPMHHAGKFVVGLTKTRQEVKGYVRSVTPTRVILETLDGLFVAVVAFK